MFFKFTAALVAAAVVQVTTAAQFNVTVGGPGVLAFNPSTVNASIGDVVLFTFMQKNHTVTQSTLANPCQLAEGGFDSGFMPVPDTTTSNFPQAQFLVQDTKPVWVYCRQANHCQQGMVFAINPADKFAAFKATAMGGNPSNSTGNSTVPPPPSSSSASLPSVITVTQTVTQPASGITSQSSSASSPAPSNSISTDHKVVVGGPSLVFQPANITAQVGDTITFQFMQKNHTATQSSFANPCSPLSSSTGPGFDSGFMAVAEGATQFPTYTIQVNNTTPIWAYCKQANHCQSGMVFAVNAVETGQNNFENFVNNAKGASNSPNGTVAPAGNSSGSDSVMPGGWASIMGVIFSVFVGSFWVMV